jgi:hypothetical protein
MSSGSGRGDRVAWPTLTARASDEDLSRAGKRRPITADDLAAAAANPGRLIITRMIVESPNRDAEKPEPHLEAGRLDEAGLLRARQRIESLPDRR